MPHPVLYRAHIESGAEHARGIRRAKGLQVESCGRNTRPLRDRFAVIEHVLFAVPSGRRKHEPAIPLPGMAAKQFHERLRHRHFALFPTLRPKPKLRVRGHPDGIERKVHIAPDQVNHFLFSETSK